MTKPLRILVCGGRKYNNRRGVYDYLDSVIEQHPIVLGTGYNPRDKRFQGLDQLAYEWAVSRGVPGRCYPAHWGLFGRSAGPRRNRRMLEMFEAEVLLAWPGNTGTANMMEIAGDAGVLVIQPPEALTVGLTGRT